MLPFPLFREEKKGGKGTICSTCVRVRSRGFLERDAPQKRHVLSGGPLRLSRRLLYHTHHMYIPPRTGEGRCSLRVTSSTRPMQRGVVVWYCTGFLWGKPPSNVAE